MLQRRRLSAGRCGETAAPNRAGNNRGGKTLNGGVGARPVLATLLLSAIIRRGGHMNWFYWNTAWSLFFSLVWFMTITHNPDARVSDAHLRDEAFGG
jgi:hypothetical protein